MKGKRFWILLMVINFVLIVFNAILIYSDSRHQDNVSADFNPQAGGGWIDDGKRIFAYSTPAMRKGAYTVSVQYAIDNVCYLSYRANTVGAAYPVIYADEYQLDSQRTDLSFRLWVNSDIDYLLIRIETAASTDNVQIDKIYIEREFKESLMYLTLRLCVILFLCDIIAAVIFYRRKIFTVVSDNIYVVLGLVFTFCITSLSLISDYQALGHDIIFHLARIVGIEEGLLSGNFPVRIQPGWASGYGYAVSVFYGDILLYIPALLYMAWVPLVYAYKVYVLCINVGTIGIAYFCYKRLSRDKHIAVVCTALYCLSIHRIVNIFVRAAVGEYSAYMFFPLVLLGMKEILCSNTNKSAKGHSWVYLCIGMTGLIQTHVLSVEMTCIILGIVVIALNRRLLNREIILAFIKSIIVTIFLNLGFLVPFLDYSQQDLQVFIRGGRGIQEYGLSLYELFSFGTKMAGGAGPSTEGLSKRFSESLGMGIIAVLVLIFICLARFTWSKSEKKEMFFLLGITGLGVFMSTCYFPWDRLAAIPYISNMEFSIQFPWRFISVIMPILVYLACLVFMKIKENVSPNKTGYILAGICLITVLQGMYYTDLSVREGNYVKYDGHDILYDYNSMLGEEYLFLNTDSGITKTDQDVTGQNVSVIHTQRNGNKVIVSCEAKQDAYIEVPLFAYNYYQCIDVATKEKFEITHGENHKIHIDLPSGYRGDLMIYFAEPWFWRMAEIISLLTFVGVMIYLIRIYKANKK